MNAKEATAGLFSDAGRAVLREFVDRATLLAFDLDGTLAPIVDTPSRVRIADEVSRVMARLCALAPVAIITGRACQDARTHLEFTPRYVVGNHGAEGMPGGDAREEGFIRQCRDWERQLRGGPVIGHPGILLENKGATLSIHFRAAADRDAALRAILDAIGRLQPLPGRVSGHCVENLVPPDAPDKGQALLALLEHSGCHRGLFVGDDETDETVFRRKDPRILGIRVGERCCSDARFRLGRQGDVGQLVAELVKVVSGG